LRLLNKDYWGVQIKEVVMGRACNTYGLIRSEYSILLGIYLEKLA